MVRKRLSDMLREEAQKPREPESDAGLIDQLADADAVLAKPAAKRRSPMAGSRTTTTSQTSKAAASEEASAIALEVTRLKTELAAAVQQTDTLNQQVSDLKVEVENQTIAAKKLQATSEKAERRSQQLETELGEAKQTILQLVEVNSQLKQDLAAKSTGIREPSVQPTAGLPGKTGSPPKNPLPTPSPIVPATPKQHLASATISQQDLLQRRQRSLAHPVFPAGNPPGHLSEQDLGWVD